MFLTDLTGGVLVLAQLEPNASVELSGDQTVGDDHHHPGDEEQRDEQQHVPGEKKQETARAERDEDSALRFCSAAPCGSKHSTCSVFFRLLLFTFKNC